MANVNWYSRRLRSMGVREIAWRVQGTAASRADGLIGRRRADRVPGYTDGEWADALAAFRVAESGSVLLTRERARRVAAAHPRVKEELLAAADRAVQLRFAYFGYPLIELPGPVDWNYDPVAEVRWPASPASKIDYRNATADVKWIWELNRLQHLPWLAQGWLITDDERFGQAAFQQLDMWLDQNPPGVGIAWRNSFEAGVRAISIGIAVQGLRDSPELTVDRYRRVVEVLEASARRCWVDRSRFSSANNHLVGELAGLAVVALLFPGLPAAGEWERRAINGLAMEADRQILADGSGAEQAVGYQVFSVELMAVVAALLIERDGVAAQPLVAVIDRSANYLAALVGPDDPDPRYGDDDEGFALRLGPEPLRTVRDHLGIAAALTGSQVAHRFGTRSWTASWFEQLRPQDPKPQSHVHSALESFGPSHYAPAGGVVVLRSGARTAVMDVGPLGYLSIAAHGHADALAVTVNVDGQQVVGDPGAGSYYGHRAWRTTHRGTRMHATIEVDGQDQSVIGGPFMWTDHAKVAARAVDLKSGIVDAEHFGYRRLAEPVTHRRWLVAPHDNAAVLVVDLLSGAGRHLVRTSWPLHPSLGVTPVPHGHLVERNGCPIAEISSTATAGLTPERVRADASNHLGWWSNRLESREPAWLVGSSCLARLPVVVATIIQPAADGQRVTDLDVSQSGSSIGVVWSDLLRAYQVTIDTTLSGCVSVQAEPHVR